MFKGIRIEPDDLGGHYVVVEEYVEVPHDIEIQVFGLGKEYKRVGTRLEVRERIARDPTMMRYWIGIAEQHEKELASSIKGGSKESSTEEE